MIIPIKGSGKSSGRNASPTSPKAELISEVTMHTRYPILSTKSGTKQVNQQLGKEKAGGDQCNISKGNMIICVKFQKQQRCKICCYSLGDKAHITGSFGFLVIWHDWFSFFSSLKKIFVLLDYIIFKCVFHWIISDFYCIIS